MSTKKMRIRIGRDGRTEIRVEGGQGEDCLAFTRVVEEALGRVEHRELTDDFRQSVTEELQIRQEVGGAKPS